MAACTAICRSAAYQNAHERFLILESEMDPIIIIVGIVCLAAGVAVALAVSRRSDSARVQAANEEIEKAIHDAAMYEPEDHHKMEQLDAISDANTAIVKAQQYLAENRKTVDKDKKHELKAQISAVQKTIRFKKPEKLTDEEAARIREETEKLKGMTPREGVK